MENEKNHETQLEHKKIAISGMICESCEKIIEKSIGKVKGVKHVKVNYIEATAKITFDPHKTSLNEVGKAIKEAGYSSDIEDDQKGNKNNNIKFAAIGLIALALLIIAYFTVSSTLGTMNLSIPQLDTNAGIAILFIVGLLTGFHCIGMCGSFVLSYTAKAKQDNPEKLNLELHGQYAIGKIISYSIIGGIFGLIGSVFVFSPTLRAGIAIVAGIFLIIYSLKMLNAHPIFRKFGIPQGIFNKLRVGPLKKNSNPLLIGLANGLFIACGPLQAMYILAMATGSFIGGATMLLAFAIGTLIPMLGFGVFASFISRGIQNNIVHISAIIVLIMGILMVNNGLALSGNSINLTSFGNVFATGTPNNQTQTLTTNGSTTGTSTGPGYQIIHMDVLNTGYSPNSFVLKTGVPVKWIINGKEITGCNGGIIVPAYGLDFKIKPGIQTIEFTPTKAGVIQWSCWMGMIQANFVVRDDVNIDANGNITTTPQIQAQAQQQAQSTPKSGGGCGCGMMSTGTQTSTAQSCH